MDGFLCPFCHQVMAVNDFTMHYTFLSFDAVANQNQIGYLMGVAKYRDLEEPALEIRLYKCPSCNKVSILADGKGTITGKNYFIHPTSNAKQLPDYVPEAIRNDYEEACEILHHSPKASATLSRRCLQGMIRDFYGITKNRLVDEINALESLISNSQWKAIDALRKIGNIGAHMEKDTNVIVDVDPYEAEKLIKLIELLIDKWYISRHDEQQLYDDIVGINNEKQEQRASNNNS